LPHHANRKMVIRFWDAQLVLESLAPIKRFAAKFFL
jgi:hypothetical protein